MGVVLTGVAGPGEGDGEPSPWGYVCWSASLWDGATVEEDLRLPGDRADIRDRSTTVALHLVLRVLLDARSHALVSSRRALAERAVAMADSAARALGPTQATGERAPARRDPALRGLRPARRRASGSPSWRDEALESRDDLRPVAA